MLARTAPDGGRILAGGQSLLPMMAFRLAQPAWLIDINRIAGLDRIELTGAGLRIPACVRHAAFACPAGPGPLGALLAFVSRHVAHLPIRTRGTFCGSLANADPASEWLTVFTALDGTAVARSVHGTRLLQAATFVSSIMTTALRDDEMLTEVHLPLLPADTRWGFHEHSRRSGDYALAMTLALFRVVDGCIVDPRLAVGGAEAQPRRIAQAEAILDGAIPGATAFAAAADAAAAAIDPIEDAQADARHRRHLVRATTRRALMQTL